MSLSDAMGAIYTNREGSIFRSDSFIGKTLGLFFATSWSPQCRDATKKLIQKYNEIQKSNPNQFEIIFLADDVTDKHIQEYFQSMPWLMLNDVARHYHNTLGDYFEVDELPSLVLIDADRQVMEAEIDDFLEIPFDQLSDLPGYVEACREKEKQVIDQLPEIIHHSSHVHKLIKTKNPYGTSGFDCDLCDKSITRERHYNKDDTQSFHCEECGYDLHGICAMKDVYHQMKCSVPNIDKCIECGQTYALKRSEPSPDNPTGTDFTCPNRCVHPPASEMAHRFLNLEVDIDNSLPPWNRTLLHSAVSAGDPDLVWHLLKKGANPFLPDHLGVTPSSLARDLWLPIAASTAGAVAGADNVSKLASRAKLIYEILPKVTATATDDNGLPYADSELLLSPPPLPQIARAHSDGVVRLRSSSSSDQSIPTFRGLTLKSPLQHQRKQKRQEEEENSFSDLPMAPPMLSSSTSVRSEAAPFSLSKSGRSARKRLQGGTQRFTSLTLARLTSENEGIPQDHTTTASANWNQILQQLTFTQLSNAIIDPYTSVGTISHCPTAATGLSSPSSSAPKLSHIVQCNACLDPEIPFQSLGFSCSRIGCHGALCLECLGRLAYVTVTSALYAVPMLKCPLCHDRIPTNLWADALDSVPAKPEEIDVLKIVDRSTPEENYGSCLAGISDVITALLEEYGTEEDMPSIPISDDLFIAVTDIFDDLNLLFKAFNTSYGEILDRITQVLRESTQQPPQTQPQVTPKLKSSSMSFNQFTSQLIEVIQSTSFASPYSPLLVLERSVYGMGFAGKLEVELDIELGQEESDGRAVLPFKVVDLLVPFVIYLHRFIPGIVDLVSEYEEDEEDEVDEVSSYTGSRVANTIKSGNACDAGVGSNDGDAGEGASGGVVAEGNSGHGEGPPEKQKKQPTLGALLITRYFNNADSLLKLLCGSCHEIVGLFFIPANGFTVPDTLLGRQAALTELLEAMPEQERIPFLRNFLEYSTGTLSPSHFISSLYRLWCVSSSTESSETSEFSEEARDFFRSVLCLLSDLERRVTAQLTFYRTFPKLYTPCCGEAHCFLCKVSGHHGSKSCEEVQQAQVGIHAQCCPGCGVPTLRTEGCRQMKCVCGMAWEWEVTADEEEEEEEDGDNHGEGGEGEGEEGEEGEWEDVDDEDEQEED